MGDYVMNIREMFIALCDGEKMREKCWEKGRYIQLYMGAIIDQKEDDASRFYFSPNGWEIYKEPTVSKKESVQIEKLDFYSMEMNMGAFIKSDEQVLGDKINEIIDYINGDKE